MKKLLVSLTLLSVFSLLAGVSALDATVTRSVTGIGSSVVSSTHSSSAPNSLRLSADEITGSTNEGRVRIELETQMNLADLNSISWMQYVTSGYISHIDIFLDKNSDNLADDVLVFEYDKVKTPSDQLLADMSFQRNQWVNTFDDKGIVDDNARGWLNSGAPGPLNGANFMDGLLSEWKSGTADDSSINGNTKILAFEIEVDGWIAKSESFIDDIYINGELIENFDNSQQVVGDILGNINIRISPGVLNFGQIVPGTTNSPALNGPIKFDATGSNTDVMVEVTDVTGFPFATGLKLDGVSPIGQSWNLVCTILNNACTYSAQSTVPTLTVPISSLAGTQNGVITYTVSGPVP